MIRRALRRSGLVLACVAIAFTAAWGVLALWYFDLASASLRAGLATCWGFASLAALSGFATRRWRRPAGTAYAVLFAALLASWWFGITPSNDRDWRAEESVLPSITVEGDRVTVRGIRNFDYRSETDFQVAWDERRFDLRELDSVDVIASYWMGPDIAHVFVSFGFGGKQYLPISIEVRKERSESYSSVRGFFRQYELYYVVADERDVIGVRTNHRRDPPEDVYLYRVKGTPEAARKLFLDYVNEIDALRRRPEFYNTLTTNCTTNIWKHTRALAGHLPFSWKILASGHVPELLYEHGRLDTRLAFAELQQRSRINDLAQAADQAADFSQRIRARLPAP